MRLRWTEPGRPVRTSTRWRLAGTHAGHGAFGPPSGAQVLILGITQAHVWNGRIQQEWTVVDELAVQQDDRPAIAVEPYDAEATAACASTRPLLVFVAYACKGYPQEGPLGEERTTMIDRRSVSAWEPRRSWRRGA